MKKKNSSCIQLTDQTNYSNQALLNAILENAGALLLILDKEGHICLFNKACEELSGYSSEEATGSFPWDFLLPPEDAERIHTEAFQALLKKPQQLTGRYSNYWISKEGRRYFIDWSNSLLLDDTNQVQYVISSGIDVTQHKQAQEELLKARKETERLARRNATILQTTLDGFMMVNVQGHIVDVNPAYEDMLGYSRDELIGKHISDIEVLDDHKDVKNRIERIKQQGYERFVSIQRHKDGTPIDVEVSVSLMKFSDEEFSFAFVRDITEQRQFERELVMARDEAEQASNAKSHFLSRMSHELRTPMNAILGFSQLLELTDLSSQQESYLGEVIHAGNHLLELIDELLELSRIEAGKMDIKIAPVDVMQVTKQAIAFVQPLVSEMRLSITLDCNAGMVEADSIRLKQVLVNLLDNATKFNRAGGEIKIRCKNQPGNRLRISITDSGEGIKQQDLDRLFIPFERLDADQRGIAGTGIGLVLSNRIVELMHGSLGVTSEHGVGSTFWVELPLSEKEAQTAENRPVDDTDKDESKKTVLYVEDNAANLRVVEELFQLYPEFKLISAVSGEKGLALIQQTLPDLVVLDIHLPGMNGFQILEAMKNNGTTRQIPVIGLSADAMKEDIEKGLDAGLVRYLTKPLDIKQLIKEVKSLLEI